MVVWRLIPDRCHPAVHSHRHLVLVLCCTVPVYKPLCIRNKPGVLSQPLSSLHVHSGGSNMDRWPLLLELDVFTWETQTGSLGEGDVSWGPGRVGGAAGNWAKVGKKDLAGRAVAVHANKIWLVSGTTVILNLHKKSIPRIRPATAACKKLEVNILPWNWTVSVMKPQEGIGFPFAPLRRGLTVACAILLWLYVYFYGASKKTLHKPRVPFGHVFT